jgi:uncharacterized protein
MKQVRFWNQDTGHLVAPHVTVADTFLRRARGLLGTRPLTDEEGLWIHPCGSVHTCFMGFSIDLLFMDSHYRITAQHSRMKPYRLALGPSGSRSVLELPAGRLEQLEFTVGQQLAFSEVIGGAHGH